MTTWGRPSWLVEVVAMRTTLAAGCRSGLGQARVVGRAAQCGIEHRLGELAGERVLLARMVRTDQQEPALGAVSGWTVLAVLAAMAVLAALVGPVGRYEFGGRAVAERRPRRGNPVADLAEDS